MYDSESDSIKLQPYSQRLAGVIAAKDVEKGYHWSPSNTEIQGIVGVERQLTSMINDPTSEVNALNECGVITVFNSYGSGFRTWGNRSAAYPTSTNPTNFICVRRTADILHESVEYSMLQFMDYHHYQQFKDVVILQKIFNHSSPQITLRYIGVEQDQIDYSYSNFIL